MTVRYNEEARPAFSPEVTAIKKSGSVLEALLLHI